MKGILFEKFESQPEVCDLPDPSPTPSGVVVEVLATGLCRSDWHGWMGHDTDIRLPHVPGHELAGRIVAVGKDVTRWTIGDRVTVPFVAGCGSCPECLSGNHQVCDHQFQPGFTHWGSFAEYVALDYADVNLVRLPESMESSTAAALGCRFVTSFRAVVDQGRLSAGEWVAVHGCGGVGLSAVMIASSLGARVIGIDIDENKLDLARALGALHTINSRSSADTVAAVKELSGGGAHLSLDALGHPSTSFKSVANLRKRGRHVQVGLMLAENSESVVPMSTVIANELEILGSHGIQAHRYENIWGLIRRGIFDPKRLVGRTLGLSDGARALTKMDEFTDVGISIINPKMP